VAAIVANDPAAFAAKTVTSTIPIVFVSGSDPVRDGLVASMNRPGANVTGTTFVSALLGPKRLELLRQLVPTPTPIGMLASSLTLETKKERADMEATAQSLGQPLVVLDVNSSAEIEPAFATLREGPVRCLLASDRSGLAIGKESPSWRRAMPGRRSIPCPNLPGPAV
jgi:putative ABC transport system substrate-binding protein